MCRPVEDCNPNFVLLFVSEIIEDTISYTLKQSNRTAFIAAPSGGSTSAIVD